VNEPKPEDLAIIRQVTASPRYFIEEILGETLDAQQIPLVEEFPYHRKIAVKSGHACFGLGTRFLMYDGTEKSVEEIRGGDVLMGDDGKPRTVHGLTRGRETMYRITYTDGTQYVHNESHVLCLVAMASHYVYKTGDVAEISVRDFMAWCREKRRRHGGFRVGVEYSKKYLPIPPYLLGVWLGDGCESTSDFAATEPEIIGELSRYADSIGCEFRPMKNGRNWLMTNGRLRGVGSHFPNPWLALLRSLGVFKNKHIPRDYMTSSRGQRLELLAGLLDTDGSASCSGAYDLVQKRKSLSEQIMTLVRSLGGRATMRPKFVSTTFKTGHHVEGTYWRVYISGVPEIPCHVKRKATTKRSVLVNHNPSHVGIKSIENLGEGDYYGFTVDGNHRILGADFMVLRNSGKDFLAARLALWYKIVHQPSIVVTTGPTDRQVQHIVWGEIRAAYRKARCPLGGQLLPVESMLRDPEDEKNYMIGFTARDDSSFQGLHSENVLVVVTEAQGIDPRIWPGIESLLSAPNAKLLLIGNAIFVPESPFYAAFTSQRGQYANFTLDSRKSSYCSKEYIEDIRQTYSEGSPMWQARVEGIFPTDVADTLIPLGWIERAQEAFKADETSNEVSNNTLGCDIARQGGDHTVFYQGTGDVFRCVHDVQGQDLMQTVGEIAKRINGGIPARRVRIDDTGLGCLVPGTEVLCESGWKKVEDIKKGDLIYSKDERGKVALGTVASVDKREGVEILESGGYEFSATHLVPHKARPEQPWQLNSWCTVISRRECYLDVEFPWEGRHPELLFPARRIKMPHGGVKEAYPEQKMSGAGLMRFLGWFLSEGFVATSGRQEYIGISQSKDSRWNEDIESALLECGLRFNRTLSGGREYCYKVWNMPLVCWLKENCYSPGDGRGVYRKRAPQVVHLATPEMINIFLNEFLKGDGLLHKGARNYSTSSVFLRDDLQLLLFKTGHYGTIRLHCAQGSTGKIDGRIITRKADNWRVAEWHGCSRTLPLEKIIRRIGDVYYLSVNSPSRLIFCRLKSGRILWTHNGGVSDRLRELKHEIVAINFGKRSTDPETLFNARTEMFWGLRERFREGRIKISPQDSRLARDLSVLKSRMTSKGQIQLEEKSRTRERLGYSPDRADALALAAMEDGMAFGLESSGEPGAGLFEYVGQLARKNREEISVAGRSPGKLSEAVVKTPLTEVTR